MRKLNLNEVKSRFVGSVSNEDSLLKIPPMEWSDDIISGNNKVTITKAEGFVDKECVQLEISYL